MNECPDHQLPYKETLEDMLLTIRRLSRLELLLSTEGDYLGLRVFRAMVPDIHTLRVSKVNV